MSNLDSAPDSVEAAVSSSNTFSGKIAYINTAGSSVQILIQGANSGPFNLSSGLTNGLTIALNAINNGAKVWGQINADNQVSQICVYST
ncbi:MAG: hypothetical protein ACI8ZM_004700 [Crocinitomix sp.]|jgi:hypothetical protein